jgi:ubiquinone/menaquinone biosynthesis C-methylase UbiE
MPDPWADQQAIARYDRWYDQPAGAAAFAEELSCLRPLVTHPSDGWLEIGVGTGRFASALGIMRGVDSSPLMVSHARSRGVDAVVGSMEAVPVADRSFNGVLMVTTASFADDLTIVLREVRRILVPHGRLVLGEIMLDSPWGVACDRKGQNEGSWFAHAHLRSSQSWLAELTAESWTMVEARSGLFSQPGQAQMERPVQSGVVPEAGFIAMAWTPTSVHQEGALFP